MSGMNAYYISRAVLSVAFGMLFAFSGSTWWMGLIAGLGAMAFFLWAPRSGRYAVHPEYGVTALRRDERTQVINDKAGRNAFIALAFGWGALLFLDGGAAVMTGARLLLLVGLAVYYLSDFILRRR